MNVRNGSEAGGGKSLPLLVALRRYQVGDEVGCNFVSKI